MVEWDVMGLMSMLASMGILCSKVNWLPDSFCKALQKWSLTWTLPGEPFDSIRAAVFTVSPNRQYLGISIPTFNNKLKSSVHLVGFSSRHANCKTQHQCIMTSRAQLYEVYLAHHSSCDRAHVNSNSNLNFRAIRFNWRSNLQPPSCPGPLLQYLTPQ